MTMRTPATTALLLPERPSKAGAARSGAPPGDSSFATLLQNDRARTATAEGPQGDASRRTRAERRDDLVDRRAPQKPQKPALADDAQPAITPQAEAPVEPKDPSVDPALQSPVAPVQPEATPSPTVATTTPFADAVAEARAGLTAVAQPAPADVPSPVVAAQPPAPATIAPVAPQAAVADAAPTAPAAPLQAVTPQAVTPQAVTPQAGEQAPVQAPATGTPTPADAQAQAQAQAQSAAKPPVTEQPAAQAEGQAEADVPTGTQAQPAPTGTTAQGRNGEHPAGQGGRPDDAQAARPAAPVAPPVAAAPAAPAPRPTAPVAEAARAVGVTETVRTDVQTPLVAPQTEAAPTTTTAPVRGAVALQHVARTVEAAMQLGHNRGITHARLHLHPAELGAIEIHLRHTANGMTARVVADSPEAVTMLQQASNDLRRTLEQAGITLSGLDIGARADQQPSEARTFAGAFAGDGENRPRGGYGRGFGASGADLDGAPVHQIRTRVPLEGGALLDVIA
jgi:flagellar hook-length control protein FliK